MPLLFFGNVISVHPNPGKGEFHLTATDVSRFQVLDALGRTVLQSTDADQRVIDLTTHPSGIYLLQLQTVDGLSVLKLVKN